MFLKMMKSTNIISMSRSMEWKLVVIMVFSVTTEKLARTLCFLPESDPIRNISGQIGSGFGRALGSRAVWDLYCVVICYMSRHGSGYWIQNVWTAVEFIKNIVAFGKWLRMFVLDSQTYIVHFVQSEQMKSTVDDRTLLVSHFLCSSLKYSH